MALSRFAGMYNANLYNYGGLDSAMPGPLVVQTGNSATGAGTVVLSLGQTTLSDGTNLAPLNTNAPVLIGNGSNAELVTPTTVSNPTPNIVGTATLSATFANLHGGDTICSGTAGLQEAINAAAAKGGGIVIVDAAWYTNGGTAAILATAQGTLPSSVTIQDNHAGVGNAVRYAQVTLTNTQTKALNSVPTAIIPAQGAGTLIEVVNMVLENVNGGVAYANGGAIQLSYGAGVTVPATATVAAAFLTSPTVTQIIKVAGVIATIAASSVLNVAVNIAAATADFITGTGTVKVRVTYVVHAGL